MIGWGMNTIQYTQCVQRLIPVLKSPMKTISNVLLVRSKFNSKSICVMLLQILYLFIPQLKFLKRFCVCTADSSDDPPDVHFCIPRGMMPTKEDSTFTSAFKMHIILNNHILAEASDGSDVPSTSPEIVGSTPPEIVAPSTPPEIVAPSTPPEIVASTSGDS